VVTAEEVLRGRLAQVAGAADGPTRILTYELLTQAFHLFTQFPIVAYDRSAEDEFQQRRSIRIGSRDLKIASFALASGMIVITRNRRHFGLVPGLTIEDWSV
jgi:tRNA(fMet)-specific endonuclease VapC